MVKLAVFVCTCFLLMVVFFYAVVWIYLGIVFANGKLSP